MTTTITQPVVELPVADVEEAQSYYAQTLGFEIAWTYPNKSIGGVNRGEAVIFHRRTSGEISPVTLWCFVEDLDAVHDDLKRLGANVVEEIETKPWNIRQFTIEDSSGHRLIFHHG
ncbi:MAG: VOC family protein [Pseudomonadales bacterium]|jgi:uncharacterized glyoxalase superfamily protein PhnB|nr:VOC family protein [Gammaproteobacteria bacterium]